MRGKSNDILANSAKYVKKPAPIDFSAYRSKLKLTSAAVDKLEVELNEIFVYDQRNHIFPI